jgi:hypothetical protein
MVTDVLKYYDEEMQCDWKKVVYWWWAKIL